MTGPVTGREGLRALPTPPLDDPLIEVIRGLLPERSADDRARGEVSIQVGIGDESATHRIPSLPERRTREWQEKFIEAGRRIFGDLEADAQGEAVVALLMGRTDVQLELLEAFNPERLSRAWLEEKATSEQIFDAFLQVTAAAFPFPVVIGRALLGNRAVAQWIRLQLVSLLYSSSTSSSPPNTAGRQRKSKTS